MSSVSEVTSTERTMIVSSRTPSATANPISVNSTSGHDRPQQQAQDQQHHAEDQRDEQVPVMGRGGLHVLVDRGPAADLSLRAGNGVYLGPDLVHQRVS